MEIEIAVPPEYINDEEHILQKIREKLKLRDEAQNFNKQLLRKSLDARKQPLFRLRYLITMGRSDSVNAPFQPKFQDVSHARPIHIVGAGPAGYFAALECLELGKKPIIIERGYDVQRRRRGLKKIQQDHEVDPDSNYCFGEGGAGTYSDGKLYTRSHKRGKIQHILEWLVWHGAKSEILTDAHPHIGSNKLPTIIASIRETILKHGGEIHFGNCLSDMVIEKNRVVQIVTNGEHKWNVEKLILCTGHSARDVYALLNQRGVFLEFKPFAMGVRVEHPQSFVDQCQLKQSPRHPNLPASSYQLVAQVRGRGVYSFCMCPGGLIVPSATRPGELVVNGMSLSRRDSAFANSGVVVELQLSDIPEEFGRDWNCGLKYQMYLENKFFENGDGSQKAPAQFIRDFVHSQHSSFETMPDSSYIPGLYSAPIHKLLPADIRLRLKDAFLVFNKKMKDYLHPKALVIGLESRTSSPVRITRNADYESVSTKGLYPCGEGAGYAGGIISAALDGKNCVNQIVNESL